MIVSKAGLDFISRWEKLKLRAYRPTPHDVLTIGFGHTKDVREGQVCTPGEAEDWLREDSQEAAQHINSWVEHPLTQPQFDALVSLEFNIGGTAFRLSNALLWLNRGDMPRFLDEAFSPVHGFVKQKGKIIPGLVNRRAAESRLFRTGEYYGMIKDQHSGESNDRIS